MKLVSIFFLFALLMISCTKEVVSSNISSDNNEVTDNVNASMKITIENDTFVAILAENSAASAFKAMLPLTLNMNELNGNEKYATLSNNLPTKAESVGRVQNGDLMLFGSTTLVLFYETFSTPYSYTPIARITAPQKLPIVVGRKDIIVKFELNK